MENTFSPDFNYYDQLNPELTPLPKDRPTKVIIDADIGGDDAQAVILALHLAKLYNT